MHKETINMKHFIALALVAVLSLGLVACKEETSSTTETSEVTDANGTVVETESSSQTTVDGEGNETTTTETKTTVDPEGALNKETVEETKTEEQH